MAADTDHEKYSAARAFAAEGARAGLITRLRCGAALLLDPHDKFSVEELHNKWHEQVEQRIQAAGSRQPTRYT